MTSTQNRKPATSPTVVPDYDESDPLVQQMIDRAPVRLSDTVAMFAEGVGLIERLARSGEWDLIEQLARNAYSRARAGQRDAGRQA
jgi:hypothetical protein